MVKKNVCKSFVAAAMMMSMAVFAGCGTVSSTGGGQSVSEPTTPAAPEYIGLEKAKELALAHFGLAEAKFVEADNDLDDGKYDFEFRAGGKEYKAEVHAMTGKVVDANVDWYN